MSNLRWCIFSWIWNEDEEELELDSDYLVYTDKKIALEVYEALVPTVNRPKIELVEETLEDDLFVIKSKVIKEKTRCRVYKSKKRERAD